MSAAALSPTRSSGSANDLDGAARAIVEEAKRQGSPDNLTVQIVRIDGLPDSEAARLSGRRPSCRALRCWKRRTVLDGYRIVREIHASSRSHIYLAVDSADGALVALKIPSIDLRGDPAYLQRFMMEEWVARRINSAHVLKPRIQSETAKLPVCRHGIRRWADLDPVDDRQSEPGPGNRARNRRADRQRAAGVSPDGDAASGPAARQHHDRQDRHGEDHRFRLDAELPASPKTQPPDVHDDILGTAQYTAPEYFLGEGGSHALRHLLARRHRLSDADRPAALRRRGRQDEDEVAATKTEIQIRPDDNRDIPAWIDGALRKAVHPDPHQALRGIIRICLRSSSSQQEISRSRRRSR